MRELLNQIHNSDMRDLIKRIPDNSISCIFTDVPYKITTGGCTGDFGWNKNDIHDNDGKIFSHNDISPSEYLPEMFRVLEDKGHIYIMVNSLHLASMQIEMEKVGFKTNNILVMVKNNAVVNRHYMKNCEFVIFARKGGSKPLNNFSERAARYVEMPRGKNKIHPTEKPLEYVRDLIQNSARRGDIVADFFAGSGVVGHACKHLGIDFILCEIDKKYFKAAKKRLREVDGNVGLFHIKRMCDD